VAEVLRRGTLTAKSEVIAFGDTQPVNVFELPGNIVVTGSWVNVLADFDASGTSALANVAVTVPGSTGAVTILSTSAQLTTNTAFNGNGQHVSVPASGGYAIVTLTPNSTTAGSFEVFMQYVDKADLL
jgi:hypothetical protein